MRFAAGLPNRWTVELCDGGTLEIWADAFQCEGDHYTFSALFDLEAGEVLPRDALVMGTTPSDPRRFILAVARIPKAAVDLPDDDEDRPAIYG